MEAKDIFNKTQACERVLPYLKNTNVAKSF